jgi:glycosyltransferase involved in cell wall biosynthesis
MRISIAIATFNRAPMVREAVLAALGQSLAPDEVVVSDDASTDHTRATLNALAEREPRLKVFHQEKNLGVANWTFAVARTGGDFIAWCSDDDRFLPGHLEASVAHLETHPEIGLVHSGFVDAVETRGSVECLVRPLRSAKPIVIHAGNFLAYMTRYYDWPFHPSTFVMRREVWEQTGAFDSARQVADTDWFVRVAERFRIALLPRHGAINRRHPDNWSNRQGSAAMQRELFEIVEKAIERRWPRGGPRRILWRALWRANVRLRLALTMRARIKTGHVPAACAAWQVIVQGTGRRTPAWVERAGCALIRRLAADRPPRFEDARQSVSPL